MFYFLSVLGQQNPELLRLINSHQDEFLTMMNEPIDEDYEDDQEEHDDDIYDG